MLYISQTIYTVFYGFDIIIKIFIDAMILMIAFHHVL